MVFSEHIPRKRSWLLTIFSIVSTLHLSGALHRAPLLFANAQQLHPTTATATAIAFNNASSALTEATDFPAVDSDDADFQRAKQAGDTATLMPIAASDSISISTTAEPISDDNNNFTDAALNVHPEPRYFSSIDRTGGWAESSDDPGCRKGGELCSMNNNCCSNKCVYYGGGNDARSVCAAGENSCLFGGEPCTGAGICCSNKCSINGQCHYGLHSCLFAGQYCQPSRDNTYNGCCGGTCDPMTGMCLAGMHNCLFGGEKCANNNQCCSQQCDIGSTNQCAISSRDNGRAQCFDGFEWCQRDWQCCSGRCSNYRCLEDNSPMPPAACYPNAAECSSNATCCSNRCHENRCRGQDWTCFNEDVACLYDADCCTNRCRNQRCRAGNNAMERISAGLLLVGLAVFLLIFRYETDKLNLVE